MYCLVHEFYKNIIILNNRSDDINWEDKELTFLGLEFHLSKLIKASQQALKMSGSILELVCEHWSPMSLYSL